MGEQSGLKAPRQAAKPTITNVQKYLRAYPWLTVLTGIFFIFLVYLLGVAFGRFVPVGLDEKRAMTLASAIYLAVGAILQSLLAALASSGRLPKAEAKPVDPAAASGPDTMDSGWPDALNLFGWGFVAAGAILAAHVTISYP